VNNLALNPVSALTRATVQKMLGDPPVRALLRAIIDEGLAIARASGVEPGVDADERLKWAEHIADVKTSMLQDLEACRPLELEPIAGAALELARQYNVAVPHVETVYGLTKLLEISALRG
jgi:2-dehydropantoate 2-reductase